MSSVRLPTADAEFRLNLYRDRGNRDHLALVLGSVAGAEGVLVRVHSECFTGDVLGSQRCDCGAQLRRAMRLIAEEGRGVLLYLRQEGRGIGLLEKLRAYNLQDAGYDTVEANIELGHDVDLRAYGEAVEILRELEVASVRLLTNNPHKVEELVRYGLRVERVPLEIPATPESASYLETKVRRMRHLLGLENQLPGTAEPAETDEALHGVRQSAGWRPSVTLAYAQSLDGSISFRRGRPMTLSCPEALELTHRLRARHDAILVGVGTVLADDPRLTVRLVDGRNPRPLVLDSRLRTPPEAQLLRDGELRPWIVTTERADPERAGALEAAGARIVRLPANDRGRVGLRGLLTFLQSEGLRSVMVEGGARVITSFLREGFVDRLAITVAPVLVGGLRAVEDLPGEREASLPRLRHPRYRWLGDNLVLVGDVQSGDDGQGDDPAGGCGGAL